MNEPVTITYSLEDVLKRIEDKIDNNQKELNRKLETLHKDVTDLKIEITEVKTEVKGINKRLDSQEFINRSVAIGVIVALVSGVIKLFFPNFLNLPH